LRKSLTNIQQIVNPAKFQKIQDDISLATGLAIITVDYTGIPLTFHSNCSRFCKKFRSSERYRNFCEKCDSRGGLEAARIRKPFIYFCHAGLIDFAIPIIVDNLYLGAFMAGQVILDQNDSENNLEHILSSSENTIDLDHDIEIREYYSMLPVMPIERIVALSNMLLHVGNYCIEEAILRSTIAQLNSKKNSIEINKNRGYISDNEHGKTSTITDDYSRKSINILQPALDYINKHPQEKILLSKMAELCNISASYFSKLFSKENTGSLSDYVNNVKMNRAKELLTRTDWSIQNIANDLGFDDCSYFIKVFKQDAGKTPTVFRNNYKNETKA